MTVDELKKLAWEAIDEHSLELSKVDWLEFLEELAADADIRAEAVKNEIGEDESGVE